MSGPINEGNATAGNDNNQPAAKAIPFSELASAMQMDEDSLLHRLATILRKREGKRKAR